MREVVPPLTEAQIRTFDQRYGLFDLPLRHPENYGTGDRSSWVTWQVVPRRQGETRMYGSADVVTARLAAWMLNEGLTYTQVVSVLRGSLVRAILPTCDYRPSSRRELLVSGAIGAVFDVGDPSVADLLTDPRCLRFPLAWLGVTTDVLPRMHKMRDEAPFVRVYNRELSREEAYAQQQGKR
ncbi:MAG TPA: hypothetical protein VM364_05835 [Vicinamibacterales bacterium]|nr:hypothetical protein [Vicinamibacterales bacterium]